MRIDTAIKQVQKEADFQGMMFLETLEDIKKHGRMLYCDKTMEAFNVVMDAGSKMFAPIEEAV